MSKSLRELADIVGGNLHGAPDVLIRAAADISEAQEGDIVFAETPKFLEQAIHSRASALIAFEGALGSDKPMITVANPRYAFARVLEVFSSPRIQYSGIHPSSYVSPDVSIGENPSIGYSAYIGNATVIGDNVCVYPFVFIGNNVRVGNNCVIHPFTCILDNVEIGNRVIIHSGTVIGTDGFGYIKIGNEHHKMPQIGGVVIGDDVEIGANVTVDRARTGKTRIGRGTKIDNLVHIAHNVIIGEDCIIVGQVGISGSVTIGDRVLMAGQAGAKDHVRIGNDAVVCARSGIIGDIEPGAFVSGYPARSHRDQMRIHAAQQRLPRLLKRVKDLEQRIADLESRLDK